MLEKIEEAYNFSQSKLEEVRKAGRNLFESSFCVDTIFPKLDKAIMSITPAKDNPDLRYTYKYHMYYFLMRRIRRFGGKILRKLKLI